jgi:hypothetical protein
MDAIGPTEQSTPVASCATLQRQRDIDEAVRQVARFPGHWRENLCYFEGAGKHEIQWLVPRVAEAFIRVRRRSKTTRWTVRGVRYDARDFAVTSAARMGVSVGEWVSEAIAERKVLA